MTPCTRSSSSNSPSEKKRKRDEKDVGEEKDRWYSFHRNPRSDVVLRSSDGVLLSAEKYYLALGRCVGGMFPSLVPPPGRDPPVYLACNGANLSTMFANLFATANDEVDPITKRPVPLDVPFTARAIAHYLNTIGTNHFNLRSLPFADTCEMYELTCHLDCEGLRPKLYDLVFSIGLEESPLRLFVCASSRDDEIMGRTALARSGPLLFIFMANAPSLKVFLAKLPLSWRAGLSEAMMITGLGPHRSCSMRIPYASRRHFRQLSKRSKAMGRSHSNV